MFCEIFLYFGLKILTRLPVLAPAGQKCHIHENTFSTQVIGIQHASTNSKLAYATKSTACWALQHVHDELVKAYGIDDKAKIRQLEQQLATLDPTDAALAEYESHSNPGYATFLRETLAGVVTVKTLNGFFKLVHARQPTRPDVLRALRALHRDILAAIRSNNDEEVARLEAILRGYHPREQEVRVIEGELKKDTHSWLLRSSLPDLQWHTSDRPTLTRQ